MVLLTMVLDVADWLWRNAPVALLVVASSWLTYKVTKLLDRFRSTEEACNDLRFNLVPALYNRVGSMEAKLDTLVLSVNKISTYIITADGLDANVFYARSPIELTDLGEKILDDTGGKKYIDDHLESLVASIAAEGPMSALDVQNYSDQLLLENSVDESFVDIKNYVFRHPVYRIDANKQLNIDLSVLTRIMGIYLRNRYLENHPGF